MLEKEPHAKLTYNRFLTIPFQSGNIVTSSIEVLDENTAEFLHSHLEYEIYYCLSGCMNLRIEDEILSLRSGDFVYIRPNVVHGVIDEPHLKKEYFICIFQPVRFQSKDVPAFEESFFLFLTHLLGSEHYVFYHDRSNADDVIHEMEHLYSTPSFSWELALRSLVLTLLIRLLENFPAPDGIQASETPGSENIAITIDQYIHENYFRDISLQDAAQSVHMTPRNVNRILQKYYGKSFQKCLMIIRLGSAKKYLIETDYSIEKIAELVGLSMQSLFRIFRQVEGINPNEYRQLYAKKSNLS